MENARYSDLSFPPPFSRPDAHFWGEADAESPEQPWAAELTGESAATRGLRLRLKRVGPYFRSALILGEDGTGKARVAAALHEVAAKDQGAFVTCDVATLEAIVEEEQKGVKAGSAGSMAKLRNEAAGGTLFFEGVAQASAQAQGLLLRSMEQWDRDRRSGRWAETRIIVSSHEDLKAMAAAGAFRQDLYERLSMVQIRVAPLRERMEDVLPLARHFLTCFAEAYGRPARELGEAAIERLLSHRWPGNVRELQSAIREAALEAIGPEITARDLPIFAPLREVPAAERTTYHPVRLQDVIDAHVLRTLQQCAGNKLRAAEMLGVSRSTLYRMLDVASGGERMPELRA